MEIEVRSLGQSQHTIFRHDDRSGTLALRNLSGSIPASLRASTDTRLAPINQYQFRDFAECRTSVPPLSFIRRQPRHCVGSLRRIGANCSAYCRTIASAWASGSLSTDFNALPIMTSKLPSGARKVNVGNNTAPQRCASATGFERLWTDHHRIVVLAPPAMF
jgi:hypothetical protein